MHKFLVGLIAGCIIASIISLFIYNNDLVSPLGLSKQTKKIYSLKKYEIKNLQKINWQPQKIIIKKVIKEENQHTSYLYYADTDTKSLGFSKNYKVSGILNLPNKSGNYPIVIMFRGFVPPESYVTGTGTRHAGEYLANSGFITIAPDFLGYGDSEYPPNDIFEARFLTYITAVSLIKSLSNINPALSDYNINNITVDLNKIAIWSHSNGGQIALTTLEILKVNYPTTLWAPVTKSFPYNILYFTDEYDDEGKLLRKKLAEFEKDYDVNNYSINCCLNQINASLQLHQGTADSEVPLRWSEGFYKNMKKLDKNISYYSYEADDHNFTKGSWQTIIARDIEFFKKYLKIE